jgi:hypothetical protein
MLIVMVGQTNIVKYQDSTIEMLNITTTKHLNKTNIWAKFILVVGLRE